MENFGKIACFTIGLIAFGSFLFFTKDDPLSLYESLPVGGGIAAFSIVLYFYEKSMRHMHISRSNSLFSHKNAADDVADKEFEAKEKRENPKKYRKK